jgi:O-antigen/teichoic acid export membrane protein
MLAGGTALSQMIAVLVAPILTRLYAVEDFGCFQLYMSVMAFGILAITLRYEQAILLPKRDEVAADLFVLVLCIVGLLAVGFCVVEWFVNRYQLLPESLQRLGPYLWIVALGTFGAGVYQALSFWALRLKAYSRVSGTKVTQVSIQLTTQTAIGFLRIGPLGLLLGDAIGRISGSLTLARLSWRQSWNLFRKVRYRTMWAAAIRYRHFPLFSSWAALLGAATGALAPLCLAEFYGLKTLGWYALGDRVLGAPILLIGQAVSQVYSVEAAAMNLSDPIALQNLFVRSVKKLTLLGIVPFILFVIFSPSLFGFVFGQSWREAGVYARLLASTQYIAFIVWPLTPTLNILERQSWQLAWDASRVVLALGSLFVAHRMGYTVRGAIGVFSVAMGLGYVAYLMLSYRAILMRVHQFRQNRLNISSEYAELVHR